MNTRPVLDESSGPSALSASLNEDNSCFAVALETGFRIFNSRNAEMKLAREVGAGIGCAQMLGTTSYIALVGGGKQPKFPQNKVSPNDKDWVLVDTDIYEVIIWNDARQSVATTVEFRTAVQRVCLSKSFLVVVLLNSVALFEMKSPPLKIAEFETTNNPFGLCCLGEKIVVFPGRTPGQVQIVELATRNVSIIPAHMNPLRALGLNHDGNWLATSSEQGTIIRMWSTASCTKVGEFRRGVDPATIFSLAFSPNSSILAVTSDKSTLHVFDLLNTKATTASEPDPKTHKWGILSKVPMLPRPFSDIYSFASAHIELGDQPVGYGAASKSATFSAAIPGVPGGRPTKGLIGWLDDNTLVVVGAGRDARWEKFGITLDQENRRVIAKEGWKKFLV